MHWLKLALWVSLVTAVGLAAAGNARTKETGNVPPSFAAKATSICIDLKRSFQPLPAAVARAAAKIPGHATPAQEKLFGTWLVEHELPDYRKAISQFRALGRPETGVAAWNQFLTGFSAWVAGEATMDREMQRGNTGVAIPSARDQAYRKVRKVAAATGTTRCLAVIG